MRLFRFGERGAEQVGAICPQNILRDLSGSYSSIIGAAKNPLADLSKFPEISASARLGAPLDHVSNFVGIGLNYAAHAAETGKPAPDQPMAFIKASNSIGGPNDPILMPRWMQHLDYEVELGVVLGENLWLADEDEAANAILGYTIVNDLSERRLQNPKFGGRFGFAKSLPGGSAVGPYLVTNDEIADPHKLKLQSRVNGELRQDGCTDDLIFGIPHILSHVSKHMKLEAGDLIATGTPAGVGMGFSPPKYLADGDLLTLEIETLGSIECKVEQIHDT